MREKGVGIYDFKDEAIFRDDRVTEFCSVCDGIKLLHMNAECWTKCPSLGLDKWERSRRPRDDHGKDR